MSDPPPGTGDRGFWLYSTFEHPWKRVQATHDVQLNVSLPPALPDRNGVWVYAPTIMPAGGSCVESTTTHRRLAGSTATGHFQGFYDWCAAKTEFKRFYDMTSDAFRQHYVRNTNGEQTLTTYVHKNTGTNCWGAGLYDYSVGQYAQLLYSCGSTKSRHGNRGWTMWESWYLMDNGRCPSLPNIKAVNILTWAETGGPKHPFNKYGDTYSQLGPYGACWLNSQYTFSQPAPGFNAHTWQGNTQ